MEVPDIMRALEPEVVEVLWQTIEPLLPAAVETHPLAATGHGFRIGCASEGS